MCDLDECFDLSQPTISHHLVRHTAGLAALLTPTTVPTSTRSCS